MLGKFYGKMDTAFFSSEDAWVDTECTVTLTSNFIEVKYVSDNEHIIYTGKRIGDNHFELNSETENGRATLHGFPNSSILEGYWIVNDSIGASVRGFWRIQLVKQF